MHRAEESAETVLKSRIAMIAKLATCIACAGMEIACAARMSVRGLTRVLK